MKDVLVSFAFAAFSTRQLHYTSSFAESCTAEACSCQIYEGQNQRIGIPNSAMNDNTFHYRARQPQRTTQQKAFLC
ncbi:hypothetical protein BDZ91DRAFT_731909 [Kalaharituber pfeilii]|nr:hypothetical protein BDZ91DRAFT_731909 [Kalaharituber pfeilii]